MKESAYKVTIIMIRNKNKLLSETVRECDKSVASQGVRGAGGWQCLDGPALPPQRGAAGGSRTWLSSHTAAVYQQLAIEL